MANSFSVPMEMNPSRKESLRREEGLPLQSKPKMGMMILRKNKKPILHDKKDDHQPSQGIILIRVDQIHRGKRNNLAGQKKAKKQKDRNLKNQAITL